MDPLWGYFLLFCICPICFIILRINTHIYTHTHIYIYNSYNIHIYIHMYTRCHNPFLSLYPFFYLFIFLIYLPICLPISLCIYLYPSINISIYPSVHLSIWELYVVQHWRHLFIYETLLRSLHDTEDMRPRIENSAIILVILIVQSTYPSSRWVCVK